MLQKPKYRSFSLKAGPHKINYKSVAVTHFITVLAYLWQAYHTSRLATMLDDTQLKKPSCQTYFTIIVLLREQYRLCSS